jgi:hypothetical protein
MAVGAHKITEAFEQRLCDYTGAPYAVAVDNCSNALFLALKWSGIEGLKIRVPKHTYPSVPCEVIHAGGFVEFQGFRGRFYPDGTEELNGMYRLSPTNVWDCALEFTANMYENDRLMCLSFTGPYKHLKLGKGGAILTDNEEAYKWFKKARFSGRNECSYLEDSFDMLGWNFYMMPEIAAKGLQLMEQFFDGDGKPIPQEPKTHRYPDLSKWPIYQK